MRHKALKRLRAIHLFRRQTATPKFVTDTKGYGSICIFCRMPWEKIIALNFLSPKSLERETFSTLKVWTKREIETGNSRLGVTTLYNYTDTACARNENTKVEFYSLFGNWHFFIKSSISFLVKTLLYILNSSISPFRNLSPLWFPIPAWPSQSCDNKPFPWELARARALTNTLATPLFASYTPVTWVHRFAGITGAKFCNNVFNTHQFEENQLAFWRGYEKLFCLFSQFTKRDSYFQLINLILNKFHLFLV